MEIYNSFQLIFILLYIADIREAVRLVNILNFTHILYTSTHSIKWWPHNLQGRPHAQHNLIRMFMLICLLGISWLCQSELLILKIEIVFNIQLCHEEKWSLSADGIPSLAMPGKARLGYNIISVEIENITAGYYDCSLPCCESDHATDNSFLSQPRPGIYRKNRTLSTTLRKWRDFCRKYWFPQLMF